MQKISFILIDHGYDLFELAFKKLMTEELFE